MSEVVTNKDIGVYTGILDVYIALMKTADTSTAAPTYDTPMVLGESIEVTITPQFAEGALNASNRVVRRKKKVTGYNIKANVATVRPEAKDIVLGRKKDANGVQILGGEETETPYVAVGLCRTKDNKAKELWWLYKAQFAEPEVSGKTEETGTVNYQTPTLEAVADRRIFDNELGMVVDSDDEGIPASVITNWFTKVYEKATEKAES